MNFDDQSYEIWFGESDRDISRNILVKGEDPRLFDRLIDGIRKGCKDVPDELYVIDELVG